MRVFKITHNILAVLKTDENESSRFFSNVETAAYVFNTLLEKIDYSKDEWISLWSVDAKCQNGEFLHSDEEQLMYFSDDTKIGVDFCPADFNKEVIDAISESLNKWTSGNYNPFEFYCAINGRSDDGNKIARAMDEGTNDDVKNVIKDCLYARYRPTSEILHILLKQIEICWI